MEIKDLNTVKETAEILGMSIRWIFKLIEAGKLKPVKIGGNIRCGMNLISREQIENLLKSKVK